MKLEKMNYKKYNVKIIFLSGFVLCAVIFIIVNIIIARASYRKVESFRIAEGKVNYSLVDFEIAELKVDGSPSDSLPIGNYELLDTSYCTTKTSNGEKDNSITLTYENNTLSVNKYTEKGMKCYLYFEDKSPKNLNELLGLYEKEEAPNGYTQTDLNNTGKATSTGKVYTTNDNDGVSYFFRGKVTDNYVKFADLYWRIVRINGDGTIRLIYQGTTANATSTNAQTGTSAYNSAVNDNTYVGYYNKGNTSSNYADAHSIKTATKPSTIAGVLDNWYKTNIEDAGFDSYVDKNAGFCNDRQIMSGVHSSYNGNGGGSSATAYAAWGRFYQNGNYRTTQYPTLLCGVNAGSASAVPSTSVDSAAYQRDLFTVSGANKGNKLLSKPIGLLTADEAVFAGAFYGQANDQFYLYTGKDYWTMSPCYYYYSSSSYQHAYVFFVQSDGFLNYTGVNAGYGVRPVINLRADITFKEGGNGTSGNPFVVATN